VSLVQNNKRLADEKNVTFAEIERKVGLSNGQIRRWDKASPKVENVQKVADFFGASIDDLLERKDISKEETELRAALKNVLSFDGEEMTESDKEAIIAYMMGRKGK
jgi:transcriptional regulator with XRE-family HTH domain